MTRKKVRKRLKQGPRRGGREKIPRRSNIDDKVMIFHCGL